MDYKMLWEKQMTINDATNRQLRLLIEQNDLFIEQFNNLIDIVEDHEKTMVDMAAEIRRLTAQLNKQ